MQSRCSRCRRCVLESREVWNLRFLDFASYYGFVPRACHPYRPETTDKIESGVRFVRSSFWPGIQFTSLPDLNSQALDWCGEANRRVHAATRAVPIERWPEEHLLAIASRPDYDTSYVSHRLVTKDCLISYQGNRYSVPYAFAGKTVTVRQTLDSGLLRIFHQQDRIAEHSLVAGKDAIIMDPAHYGSLPQRERARSPETITSAVELTPGPGVGLHHAIPEVQMRPLAIYEEVAYVAAA